SIRLNLEQDATISVEVYNVNGQLMASLVNGRLQAGSHMLTWESSADRAAEGVYFFRIVTEDQVVTRKVILVQ
ncbi:MAG TPA: T9SS type A sorting domain-containing protein, partial [Bacteroidales bacterium]|nr:T9SS type A sorting domain-containing protein [Bacteroidales bacterium]